MKKILSILPVLSLASCVVPRYPNPLTVQAPENNTDYKVYYLFEHEGCKVYRFYDYGNTVYFTNCSGDTVAFGDSTQVRSSGSFKGKPFSATSLSQTGTNETVQRKPLDLSPFTRD